MLDLRYFFVSLFIITLSLLSNPISHVASEEENTQDIFIEVTKESNKYKPFISQNEDFKSLAKEEYIELKSKNNYLSLLGMGMTSILFLAILIVLFKKDKQFTIEEDHEKNQRRSYVVGKNDKKPEMEELVFQPNFSKPNREIKKDLSEEKLEIPKAPSKSTSVDMVEEESHINKSKVSSDVMGKLTIETSSTTEIDVVFELIKDLQNDSNSSDFALQKDLRRKAIWELGQTNDFRAIKPLIQTISKVDSLEKNLILDSITQIANHSLETIRNVLLTSLEDDCIEVRKNAIQDFTSLYQSMSLVTAHLSKMTEDSDQEVQETAMWALEQFKQISIPVASIEYTKKKK